MIRKLLSLWLLMIFATPPTNYAYRCDPEWRAGLQEPSDTPNLCIDDAQEAVLPDSFQMCPICRTDCGIILGEVPFQGATPAQVAPRCDQWDYG